MRGGYGKREKQRITGRQTCTLKRRENKDNEWSKERALDRREADCMTSSARLSDKYFGVSVLILFSCVPALPRQCMGGGEIRRTWGECVINGCD